jgi:hypothetical protein
MNAKQTEYYIYLDDKELQVVSKPIQITSKRKYNNKPIPHSSLKAVLLAYAHLQWNLKDVQEPI